MTTPVNNTTAEDGGVDVAAGAPAPRPVWEVALIVLVCSLMVVGTIVGNTLVCTAVSIVRKLRTPSNWLIVSLAVADLLVALLVMPLAIVYEVRRRPTARPPLFVSWSLTSLFSTNMAISETNCHSL